MCVYYNITTSDEAYRFLLDELGFQPGELIAEYLVDCNKDTDAFWERNAYRLNDLDINEVRFVAFHVTGSLDDCKGQKENGIRNLRYVLSHDTMLSKLLKRSGICFNIENCKMYINEKIYNIDYDNYKSLEFLDPEEECLESISHRIYYDFCVDGFWANDNVEEYGTDIHERPEFISTLLKMSPEAKKLDAFWRANSNPYKIFFFATLDQIHKFTFGLEKNYDAYTENEQVFVKKWMVQMALSQAFDACGEFYIYIREDKYIPPQQIIKYERLKSIN